MLHFDPEPPAPVLLRFALLVLAVLCLLIGIVGIVLPIIPGILFLALGAWLLARVSRRAAARLDAHPGWQKGQRIWYRSRHLSPGDKLRLTTLLACRSVLDGIRRLTGQRD